MFNEGSSEDFLVCAYNTGEPLRVIQLITGSADFGGAQAHVRELAAGVWAQGHECVIVTGPPDGLFSRQLRAQGFAVHVLPTFGKALHPVKDVVTLVRLLKKLRELKPDLVAAHTAKAGFLGRVACAILGIPCVFTPHGWSIIDRATGKINRTFKLLERLGGFLGSGVITVCRDEYQTGRASGLTSPEKLFCVYNGISDTTVRSRYCDENLTVIMVARFTKQKDHATVLRALSLLKDYPWHLQLVGSGPLMESIRRFANSLGVANRVEFLGECGDTADILSRSAVFVLGTLYEAFPISILEAMRSGLPVLASRVGGIPEAVSDGVSGFLVPPSRDDLLAESLKRLLMDASLREEFGRNGRQIFLDRFTNKQMVLHTLDVYNLLLKKNGKLLQNEVVAVPPTSASRPIADSTV